jgi:hypothetical protein
MTKIELRFKSEEFRVARTLRARVPTLPLEKRSEGEKEKG